MPEPWKKPKTVHHIRSRKIKEGWTRKRTQKASKSLDRGFAFIGELRGSVKINDQTHRNKEGKYDRKSGETEGDVSLVT